MTQSFVRCLATSAATVALLALPAVVSPTLAQDTSAATTDAPANSGDIVVTASKRTSTTIQNTPIAVQALSGAELRAKGALDFGDYFHSIAGLSAQDEGPGDKRYVIRGVNSGGASTVGMYLDEVIITGENSQDGSGQAPDIKLFDIDRVEVLKGPQGTTFGSSALAGTIRYITAKPDLDKVGGYIQSSLKATDGTSRGYQTDGANNLPIISDVFGIRASGYYANLPGWIDNRFEKGANNELDKAVRLEARWKITDDLTLDGMAMYQKVHQDAKNYYNDYGYDGQPLTGSKYEQADYARAPYDDKSQIYNATLNYKQPWGTFTATGSRFVRDTDFVRDASLAAVAFGIASDYATDGASVLNQVKHRRVDSAEARFASSFGGPFQILAGAFLSNEQRNFESAWPTVDAQGNITSASSLFLDRTVDTTIHERALFGEISYQFTPRLTGTAGARVFDIKLNQQADALVAFGGGAGAGPGAVFKTKENGVIGRFNLAYKMSDQVNTYIQIAQGYRPGGTNDTTAAQIAHVTIPEGFSSDSLWNYEAGVKTTLLDRKLLFDTSVYYIDWSHIQTSMQATDGTISFGYTGNGGKASVKGAEVTVDYRPIHGLQINLSGNYSLAKLDRDNPVPSTGLKGDRVPYTPKWSGSASAAYTFPIPSLGVNGTVGGDVSYQGSMSTEFNSTIDNYHKLPSYALVGLRAGISKDRWALNLIGSNILNDHTVINYNDIVPGVYPNGYYINRPRTITLSASVKF